MKIINTYFLGQTAKILIILFFTAISLKVSSQSIGVTFPAFTGSYCAGTNLNITFTISGTFLNVPAANVFSAQVSDNIGSFAGTPVTIGTRTSTTAGLITCTFPSTLFTSGLYRIRVISSNPPVNGSDNGADLTIVAITLNAPTIAQTSFCQSETITVNYAPSFCPFINIPAANEFSVELSNASGSFTNPLVIGTRISNLAGAITCSVPPGTPAGTGYRIRVTSSNPAVISPDNGANIAVMSAVGNPTVFGTNRWNVYCYNTRNDFTNNYQGFYAENNLSFNTTTRWATNVSPSSANGASGLAYSGCTFPPTNASFAYKRTNIPCGYYRIDINAHRNELSVIINGTTIFTHTNASGDAHTAIFTDMIDPTDEIQFLCATIGGTGNLQVTFTRLNQLVMSAPVTVCANTTATLTTSNTGTLPVTYNWLPISTVMPSTGAMVIATPSAT